MCLWRGGTDNSCINNTVYSPQNTYDYLIVIGRKLWKPVSTTEKKNEDPVSHKEILSPYEIVSHNEMASHYYDLQDPNFFFLSDGNGLS